MAYGAVDRKVWHDEKFRTWDRDTREMWLYLLTCPHGNRIGCFVLDPYYAAGDLQRSPDEVKGSLNRLQEEGRIVWDGDARVVCIRKHLHPDYNPLSNPNVVKAARKDLQELPDSQPAFRALLDALTRWERDHYAPLIDAVRNRLGKGSERVSETLSEGLGEPSRNGTGNHDHEHEQEHEHEGTDPPPSGACPRRARPLADYLGDHGEVVLLFHERFGREKPTWAPALMGQFGPTGTKPEVWDEVPDTDRPTLLAAAMWAYIGDADEYSNPLFQSYLERQVREYWEAGEPDKGDLSVADEKIIEFRQELEAVDLEVST